MFQKQKKNTQRQQMKQKVNKENMYNLNHVHLCGWYQTSSSLGKPLTMLVYIPLHQIYMFI